MLCVCKYTVRSINVWIHVATTDQKVTNFIFLPNRLCHMLTYLWVHNKQKDTWVYQYEYLFSALINCLQTFFWQRKSSCKQCIFLSIVKTFFFRNISVNILKLHMTRKWFLTKTTNWKPRIPNKPISYSKLHAFGRCKLPT